MNDNNYVIELLKAAEDWLCDGYSADIRYLIRKEQSGTYLQEALITFLPLSDNEDRGFLINLDQIISGQIQLSKLTKAKCLEVLTLAINGGVKVVGKEYKLPKDSSYDFYSESVVRERWMFDLHLEVSGAPQPFPSNVDGKSIDDALRLSLPPFDGLVDLTGWLKLNEPFAKNDRPSVKIRIMPPVVFIFDQSSFTDDKLKLTIHAQPKLDVNTVRLSIRSVPGSVNASRKQVGSEIFWQKVRNGRRAGTVEVECEKVDSVLAMLMLGKSTVQRQWFLDPIKARNNRLVAVKSFDKDLRMIRRYLFELSDTDKFEAAISALLFLLGFSPSVQLEKDSPDIIATTPAGHFVLIECTTRIADFNLKLGKLVDRKGALQKVFQSSGHFSKVYSVLVCGLPETQIAANMDELSERQVILVTKEMLESAFIRLDYPNDPDKLLESGLAAIAAANAKVLKKSNWN